LDVKYKGITYRELRKIYLEDMMIYREPNTVRAHEISLQKFDGLENKVVGNIDFIDIKNEVNKMIKEGLEISTIQANVSRLNLFLNAAINEYKAITNNPLKDIKLKLPSVKKKKEIRVLTNAEVEKLLNLISPEKDKMIVLIAVKCGLRAGEIVGLTWNDVDFKNADLIVDKQWKKLKTGEYGFGTLKSKNSYRKVPIPADVIPELKKYKENAPRELKYDRVFPENTTSNLCTRLRFKFKRLGFENSMHDLRHTYATNLVARNIDFKTVSMYMGDTVDMVIKTYAHFTDEMYEAGKAKINNL
jgi:integrase